MTNGTMLPVKCMNVWESVLKKIHKNIITSLMKTNSSYIRQKSNIEIKFAQSSKLHMVSVDPAGEWTNRTFLRLDKGNNSIFNLEFSAEDNEDIVENDKTEETEEKV